MFDICKVKMPERDSFLKFLVGGWGPKLVIGTAVTKKLLTRSSSQVVQVKHAGCQNVLIPNLGATTARSPFANGLLHF